MTKYVKFVGTRFADTLGIATTSLNQKLLGKGGEDVLLGGLGNDKINGGKGNDWIVAGAGNDDIDGGQGVDIAVYSGRFSEYKLTFKSNLDGKVEDLFAGRDGTDTLKKVEFLKFSDGIYDIASDTFQFFNQAPTLGAPAGIAFNDTAAHDTFPAAFGILSATDPNGDTLTFGLQDGGASTLAGYDISKSTGYGTMYLNSATGAYTFVPISSAIEALKTTSGIACTFTVTDGEFTDSKTLTVTMNGVNDPASITGDIAGAVTAGSAITAQGTLVLHDPDVADQFLLATSSPSGPHGAFMFDGATGAWSYTVSSDAPDVVRLGADDVRHDTLTVKSLDGTSTVTIDVAVHGANDAPVLQNPTGGDPVLADDRLTLSFEMAFSDLDVTDTHTVTVTALGGGYIGHFTPPDMTDSTGGAQGSVSLNYLLTLDEFMQAGGNIPLQQDYLVTIDDHHGGVVGKTVSIPLADILDNGGGGSSQPPMFLNISPPNPFVSGQNLGQIVDNANVLNPPTSSTNFFVSGTLFFSDPDGGSHHAFVDLAHAFVAGHNLVASNGALQPISGGPVGLTTGTWQVFAQEPNQVFWGYTLSESVIRSMSQGESLSMVFPIVVVEDGVGQSVQNVKIDVFGTSEIPFLLPPGMQLTASTDISPYLLPPNFLTHIQTQASSINEDPSTTGSGSHHTVSGKISFIDPDVRDIPTVTMTPSDPGRPQTAEVQALMNGFHYTVQQFGNYGTINWTYDVPDAALDFLGQGDVLTVGAQFRIGGIDGTAFSVVNVSLHGVDEPLLMV